MYLYVVNIVRNYDFIATNHFGMLGELVLPELKLISLPKLYQLA